jgi:hypothetical protein
MNALPLAASRELHPAVGGLTLRKFPRTLNLPVQRGISTCRPGECRDPSVSAIALIAAAWTLVFALEHKPVPRMLRSAVSASSPRYDLRRDALLNPGSIVRRWLLWVPALRAA